MRSGLLVSLTWSALRDRALFFKGTVFGSARAVDRQSKRGAKHAAYDSEGCESAKGARINSTVRSDQGHETGRNRCDGKPDPEGKSPKCVVAGRGGPSNRNDRRRRTTNRCPRKNPRPLPLLMVIAGQFHDEVDHI